MNSSLLDVPLTTLPALPEFAVDAALYFLPCGQYLFLWREGDGDAPRSKFLTHSDAAAAFGQGEQDSGWIMPGLARSGHNQHGTWYVAFRPAQKTALFVTDDSRVERLIVPLPSLLMMATGVGHYVVAIKGDTFDPAAEVFNAPLPNLGHAGKVCWGSNTRPANQPSQVAAGWESFFLAPFSSHQAGGKSKKYPNDARLLLRELNEAETYPCEDAVPFNAYGVKTVTQWAEKVRDER